MYNFYCQAILNIHFDNFTRHFQAIVGLAFIAIFQALNHVFFYYSISNFLVSLLFIFFGPTK